MSDPNLSASDERTLLAHQLDTLQGLLTKNADECCDLLRVGLQAVKRDVKNLPILVERVEVVLQILNQLSESAQNSKEI